MTGWIRTIIHDGKGIPLGIKLIVFVIFLRALGWGFVDPLFPIYLNQFGDEYTLVGSLVSIIQAGSFLMLIPLARITDKVREGVLIQDGEFIYFFVIVCYILAGIFKSIPLLLLGLFLNGIGQPLIVSGAETYIRKHDPSGKAAPFGFYVSADNFGWVIGMVIGAFLIHFYGLNWMFAFVLPSILFSFFILPHVREHGIGSFFRGILKYFHKKEDFVSLIRDARAMDHKMFFFLILAFFDGVLRMVTFTFIPLFGLYMHLSMTSISLLMAVMYMPFVFSFFFSEIEDRLPRMQLIAFGLFIATVSYALLFFIVHQAWLILIMVMTSFAMAIVRPAYNGAITRLTMKGKPGEMTGFNNLAERFGRIVGPIFIGFLADIYGIKTAFLAVAVIAFVLCMASLTLRSYNSLVVAES